MSESISKESLPQLIDHLQNASFTQKKEDAALEQRVNELLDSILELKQLINAKSEYLEKISDQFHAITWFNNLNDHELALLNNLIAASRDYYSVLARQSDRINAILEKTGIANEERKRLEQAIANFKEDYETLEKVFFYYPKDGEINDLINEIEQLE